MTALNGEDTPLDPQCLQVLEHVKRWGEIGRIPVAEAREVERLRARELGGPAQPVADVRSVRMGDVSATLYTPAAMASGVLVWFHGGGWVLGAPELSDDQTRALANASGCVVVSVDYRLAPEHPFPTGLEDCYRAVTWVHAHLDDLGAPPARVAVGGDSAGGNLAAAVSLLARDRGGPRIDFQLLVYPALRRAPATASYRRYARGHWLTAEEMDWFWDQYLPQADQGASSYAEPLLAANLEGLPPALVVTAEYDVLRDEGELYADRLAAAGVPVRLRRYEGMLHGFISCAGAVDEAARAFVELGHAISTALSA